VQYRHDHSAKYIGILTNVLPFNARDRDFILTLHPPQLNTTMTKEEALAELDTLKSNEEFCYADIAKKHGVPRLTLSRKH
jgi:hypothetical protein